MSLATSSPLRARVKELEDELGITVGFAGEGGIEPGTISDGTCGRGRHRIVRLIERYDRPGRGPIYLYEEEPVLPPPPPGPVVFEQAMGWTPEEVAELQRIGVNE